MPPLPVTIFTGFLGSGKTTLLTSLLAAEREQRFAIVVNEFGAVSVDDVLLARALDASRASVFQVTQELIAYAGDVFRTTMLAISDDARRFDHVLIETSGLAVPTAVIAALQSTPLRERFRHDATLTIVDTPLLLTGVYDSEVRAQEMTAGMAATEVFQQQLQCADVVVLNKIDHCTEAEFLQAESAIRRRAAAVRFVELAWHANLDARLVLGLHLNEVRAVDHTRSTAPLSGLQTLGSAHVHSGLGAHEHGLLTHEHLHTEDPGWLSFVLHSQSAQHPETLQRALHHIATQEPVLRVKGFAHAPDRAGHLLVQGVRTRIVYSLETAPEAPSKHAHQHTHGTTDSLPAPGHTHAHSAMAELVFIGYHLHRDTVAAQLTAQTGTPWH